MADEDLADRIRAVLASTHDAASASMFGGLALLVGGHVTCGIVGTEHMLRLGEDGADAAPTNPTPARRISPASRWER